jgi:hypothetical protein
MDRVTCRRRADRAYHDIAQVHLHEFATDRGLYPDDGRS